MGEGAPLGADLLAVHEDPPVVALAGRGVEERREGRQVRRAQPSERDARGRGVVGGCARVPGGDLMDQVLGGDDGEIVLADRPLGDEGGRRPVRADGADGAAQRKHAESLHE
jgi:hypothetical protein